MSDRLLALLVRKELSWDTRFDNSRIGIHVCDGLVTLTGTVPHAGDMIHVLDDVWAVRGVNGVMNRMFVDLLAEPRLGLARNAIVLARRLPALRRQSPSPPRSASWPPLLGHAGSSERARRRRQDSASVQRGTFRRTATRFTPDIRT